MSEPNIKIIVVDDTVTYRKIISDILAEIEGFDVVGTAANGQIALQKIKQLQPDIITLDLEMPVMDGLDVLAELKKRKSTIGAIMLSAFTAQGAEATVRALDLGAFDFALKPSADNIEQNKILLKEQLVTKIQTFMRTRPAEPAATVRENFTVHRHSPVAETVIPKKRMLTDPDIRKDIVVIGISTGGPQSLSKMLPELPGNFPLPILIVQHMPPMFTQSLADDLNRKCHLNVCQAHNGQIIAPGNIYIAPGGNQMKVIQNHNGSVIVINDDPPENSCKPSVDYLFRSVAHTYGENALAVIMTGMGSDGTLGCRLLKRKNATVIAQDKNSCVVYGMPKQPIEEGLVDTIAPLDRIASEIIKSIKRGMALCK